MTTNENSNLKTSKPKFSPFLLSPAGKDYLWGGRRLKDLYSKDLPLDPLAETWECSTHPDGLSTVASGEFQGKTLKEVLLKYPELLGNCLTCKDGLPVLIKLIDAKENLSVQVHPDDEYAKLYENGSMGKTEMWYVLDAEEGAQLIYGFRHEIDAQTLKKSVEEGTVEKHLQSYPIQKDDVFFIPAGQVHAIGKGALIAEVQECSNLTYRLYDYNRLDKDGNPRQLHVDKALKVINFQGSETLRQPMRVLKFYRGKATELLCRCQYFQVSRVLLNTERMRESARIRTYSDAYEVLLCTDGCGTLSFGEEVLNFYRGDCIFVPANCKELNAHGRATLLKIEC